MDRKRYTVILVPHTRAKFRKFQVSATHLWAALAIGAVTILGSALLTWNFLAAPIDETQVSHLRHENDELRQVNQSFEKSIQQLQSQLATYEERTRKLAIVAGVEELDTGGDTGIGGASHDLVSPDSASSDSAPSLDTLSSRVSSLDKQLDAVEGRLDERLRWISSVPTVTPAGGLFTSGFGPRRDPVNGRASFHEGLDIAAAPGKPIHASADGLVVLAGQHGDLGNAVVVSHGFGLSTRYGHMSRVAVQAGQRVRRGDVLGYVGNTGHSTGYHLHYEVLKDGQPVNPLGYILDRPLGD